MKSVSDFRSFIQNINLDLYDFLCRDFGKIIVYSSWPAAADQQQDATGQQPAAADQQQDVADQQPAAADQQQVAADQQPAAAHGQADKVDDQSDQKGKRRWLLRYIELLELAVSN